MVSLFAIISGASAADIYVNTVGNDITGNGSSSNPYASLNKSASIANNVDTANIANAIYTGFYNRNIVISKNMTIAGQTKGGVIINAQYLNRMFYINSGVTVNFVNITFINGNVTKPIGSTAPTNGGAIYTAGNLIINECEFVNNSANSGGAIYSNSPVKIEIYNSRFANNIANPWKITYENFSASLQNY